MSPSWKIIRIDPNTFTSFFILFCWGCYRKIPQIECLQQQKFIFLLFWRMEVHDQSSIRVSFWWDLSYLPDLQTTLFLLCPHTVCPPCEHRKRGSFGVSSFSNKNISLSDWGPDHMTSFNLNYLPKGPISKYSHMEIWASTKECGGGTIQPLIFFGS